MQGAAGLQGLLSVAGDPIGGGENAFARAALGSAGARAKSIRDQGWSVPALTVTVRTAAVV